MTHTVAHERQTVAGRAGTDLQYRGPSSSPCRGDRSTAERSFVGNGEPENLGWSARDTGDHGQFSARHRAVRSCPFFSRDDMCSTLILQANLIGERKTGSNQRRYKSQITLVSPPSNEP